jgi:hypothetical protein
MNKSIVITRNIVMVAGVVQLILGMLFWADVGKSLIPLHATIGSILVLSLWVMAFLSARAGAPIGLVVLVVVWGLILPVVGLGQTSVLHGSLHWIVQVVHLLLGLTALGLAALLSSKMLPRKAEHSWDVHDPAGT